MTKRSHTLDRHHETQRLAKTLIAISESLKDIDMIDTYRSHRWVIDTGGTQYLSLKSVEVQERQLTLEWYISERSAKFIFAKKYPSKMELAILNGGGDPIQTLTFSGVKFIRNDMQTMTFDYAESGIQIIKAVLSYKEMISHFPKAKTPDKKTAILGDLQRVMRQIEQL